MVILVEAVLLLHILLAHLQVLECEVQMQFVWCSRIGQVEVVLGLVEPIILLIRTLVVLLQILAIRFPPGTH